MPEFKRDAWSKKTISEINQRVDAYQKCLKRITGMSKHDIEIECEEDNQYLDIPATYSGLEDLFVAGWKAGRRFERSQRKVKPYA